MPLHMHIGWLNAHKGPIHDKFVEQIYIFRPFKMKLKSTSWALMDTCNSKSALSNFAGDLMFQLYDINSTSVYIFLAWKYFDVFQISYDQFHVKLDDKIIAICPTLHPSDSKKWSCWPNEKSCHKKLYMIIYINNSMYMELIKYRTEFSNILLYKFLYSSFSAVIMNVLLWHLKQNQHNWSHIFHTQVASYQDRHFLSSACKIWWHTMLYTSLDLTAIFSWDVYDFIASNVWWWLGFHLQCEALCIYIYSKWGHPCFR